MTKATQLRDALDCYRQEEPEADDVIRQALERGRLRAPKKHDVFVHPEFPFIEGMVHPKAFPPEVAANIGKYWWKYHDLIAERLRVSPSPVVLTYGGENRLREDRYLREWALGYPANIAIPTHVLGNAGEHVQVNGKVSLASFRKIVDLWDGMHPDDDICLHGADFADCVPDFGEQVAALKRWNTFQVPHAPKYHHEAVRAALVEGREIMKTRICIGIAYDARNTRKYVQRNGLHNSTPAQLLRQDSVLIPDSPVDDE